MRNWVFRAVGPKGHTALGSSAFFTVLLARVDRTAWEPVATHAIELALLGTFELMFRRQGWSFMATFGWVGIVFIWGTEAKVRGIR